MSTKDIHESREPAPPLGLGSSEGLGHTQHTRRAMMEWKDVSSYSRGQTDRRPNTFSAQCGPMRLVVLTGHIHHPGKWVAHAFPLFESRVLKATTREEAQVEAVKMAHDWLSAAAAAAGGQLDLAVRRVAGD